MLDKNPRALTTEMRRVFGTCPLVNLMSIHRVTVIRGLQQTFLYMSIALI